MCLFPVPFPLTPSLRPQVSSINPTVTRSLLYSVLRDAPSDRGGQGQQSRDAQLSEYPSLDYQGLYVTLVTLLDLVPLLQHGQHGESRPSAPLFVIIIPEPSGLHEATSAFLASFVTGGEKSCWGSWGMHGVIGSTLEPVNLIVHKPLDTPAIGLLFCASYLTACLFCKVGQMFYLCCHVQIYKSNWKTHLAKCAVVFIFFNTFTVHLKVFSTLFFTGPRLPHIQCLLFMNILPLFRTAQKHENPSPRLERFPVGKL